MFSTCLNINLISQLWQYPYCKKRLFFMKKNDPYGPNAPLVDMIRSFLPGLFEDDDLLILNKPGWLVCHPSKDGLLSSLVGAVRMYTNLDKLHLVARLDRETSGLVIIIKRSPVARKFQMAIQDRKVGKEYLAILEGALEKGVEVKP